ncbi:hypothetical protein [Caulobacter sp. 17J80-11]|uniref:hypothetical protein n=1 Tax=Caulobacter sp. 17J80-11 TaxID=2763502 RepID=UPI00165376C2|nr:hypothetical protein [Caulobacter sp. 17J80-11]MBC6981706.1 hypothetical protein [Caulobacter sp. 17J80-11]
MASIVGTPNGDTLQGTSGADVIDAGGGADRVTGEAGDDQLMGGAGDDVLEGGTGSDVVYGQDGDDVVGDWGQGDDQLFGGAGNDTVQVGRDDYRLTSESTAYLDGGEGDDLLTASGAYAYPAANIQAQHVNATLVGEGGADKFIVGANVDAVIYGGDGDDLITVADAVSVTVTLGAGTDVIRVFDFKGTVQVTDFQPGDQGDVVEMIDFLQSRLTRWDQSNPFATGHLRLVQAGADTIVQIDANGGGDSWADVLRLQGVQASALTAFNFEGFPPDGSDPAGRTIVGTDAGEYLEGSFGGDLIQGAGGDDIVNGGGGDDQIQGGDGDDILTGGSGTDVMFGGDGDDTVSAGPADVAYGEAGDDELSAGFYPDGTGHILLDGGEGDDLFRLSFNNPGQQAITARGGDGDDVFLVTGAGAADASHGATLTLGEGRDVVTLAAQQAERPTIVITDFQGGPGGDRVDLLPYLDAALTGWDHETNPFSAGLLRLTASEGSTLVQAMIGGAWTTLVVFEGVAPDELWAENLGGYGPDGTRFDEVIVAEEWADADYEGVPLTGGAGADQIFGGSSVDELRGDRGDDLLLGGEGSDRLFGGSGDDVLVGGGSYDRLSGGAGHDSFVFVRGDGQDAVLDFDPTQDRLDVYDYSGVVEIRQVGLDTVVTLSPTESIHLYNVQASQLTTANLVFHPAAALPRPPAIVPPGAAGHTLVVTGSYTHAQGAALYTRDDLGLTADNASGVITNAGRVIVAAESGYRARGVYGSNMELRNLAGGEVRVSAPNALDTWGVSVGQVVNAGLIAVDGADRVTGVLAHTFENSGTVRAWATGAVYAVQAFDFTNSGVIEAFGLDAVAVAVNQGPFYNSGTIRAQDSAALSRESIAVQIIAQSSDATATYVNNGLIEGDYAIRVWNPFITSKLVTSEVVQNDGVIRGIVDLDLGDDRVINTGEIVGRIELGAGADVYDGTGGTQTGGVHGGFGADRLTGGDGTEVFFGESGADVISGGAGDDLIDGGLGSDQLDGGAGYDTLSFETAITTVTVDLAAGTASSTGTDAVTGFEHVIGGRYDDTLAGASGAERLDGGEGNDVLDGRAGADQLAGGRGEDVLTGGAGDDAFVFVAGDGRDVVADFTAGGGEDRLVVYGYSGYRELRQVGADTLVVLSPFDSVLLKNVQASSLTAADFSFNPQAPAQTPSAPRPAGGGEPTVDYADDLWVASGETVRITGSIRGFTAMGGADLVNEGIVTVETELIGTGGILDAGGGVFDNRTGAVFHVEGPHATGVASYSGGMQIKNAGLFEILTTGFATGYYSAFGVLQNLGTFRVVGDDATGVYSINDLSFSNTGLIEVVGETRAVGIEIEMPDHWSSFANYGEIRVAAGSAGESVGVLFGEARSTPNMPKVFENYGLIEAEWAFMASAWSSTPGGPISIVNAGVIHGRISLLAEQDQILNTGEIVGRIDLYGGNDVYDGAAGLQSGGGIYAGDGNDVVRAGAGAQELFGGAGDDLLAGGAGDDLLDGGAGFDIADYTAADGNLTISLAIESQDVGADLGTDRLVGIEGLFGGRGADRLTGSGGADLLAGGLGDDVLTGGAGADRFMFKLDGGNDVVTDFQVGVDVIDLSGQYGFLRYVELRQVGADTLVVLSNSQSVLLKNVTASSLTNASFRFVSETDPRDITGTAAADVLTGASGDDTLTGLEGDDVLYGRAGRDVLSGGAGNDFLHGGTGNDRLDGGDGDDTVDYSDAGTQVLVWLGSNNTASNTEGSDVLVSIENAIGSYTDDLLSGNDAANRLSGLAGPDRLYGFGGDDLLTGGAGDDRLDGGDGVDTASYSDATSGVTVSLALPGVAQVTGGAGTDTVTAIENLIGSAYADTLTGTDGVNVLTGGGGNDVLTALGGDDVLNGGAGADVLDGGAGVDTATYADATAGVTISLTKTGAQVTVGSGSDTLISIENLTGSAFADNLRGNSGANVLIGGAGDDVIEGGGGADRLDGGVGADTATYANTAGGVGVNVNLRLTGQQNTVGAGMDVLIGFENLTGSRYDDRLTGDAGANVLVGGSGADVLWGGAGNDRLDGGIGADTAVYSDAAYGVNVNLNILDTAQDTGGAGIDTLLSIDNVVGSVFADSLRGNSGANTLEGGAGNDVLEGGGGSDRLIGGEGIDTASYANSAAAVTVRLTNPNAQVTGGAGSDTLSGIENLTGSRYADRLTGDDGNNVLTGGSGDDLLDGGAGNDTLDGGLNFDTATYAGASGGVTVNLTLSGAQNTGGAGVDTLISIENVTGSAFNDSLRGNTGANTLIGGAGDDILEGGGGEDRLDGGGGIDTASYAHSAAAVTINLNAGGTQPTGGAGTDTLISIENVTGSAFADTLRGNAVTNVLDGGAGADVLLGGGGNDVLIGGAGDDVTSGGTGDDLFVFGPGFGQDRIDDFVAGGVEDRLDFSAYTGTGVTWTLTQVGDDAVFSFSDGSTLTLAHVQATSLAQTGAWGWG